MLTDPIRQCVLYDTEEVEQMLDRMAMQLAPLITGRDAVLIGILRRGAPIAARLQARLAAKGVARRLRGLEVRIQRYADDLRLLHPDTPITEDPAHAGLDLSGCTVVLVDDVLYRGHSLARAMDWALRRGAAEVRVAVLVDREVAMLPLRADLAGARLQVAPEDVIECHVPPYEPDLSIMLVRPRR